MQFRTTVDDLDKLVHAHCRPLFANGRFLQGGHSQSTTNATVTFIQRKDRQYAVTCHHVIAAFLDERHRRQIDLVPSVHHGRSIHQFGSYSDDGKYRWVFISCRDFATTEMRGDLDALDALTRENSSKPDIAIADITSVWEAMRAIGGLSAINLDAPYQDDWSHFQPHFAAYVTSLNCLCQVQSSLVG